MRLIAHPVLCNYYLTYRCNASCGFCDIWEKPSPYADLKTIAANLIDLKKLGVRVVDFTGGEPLLHRQIDQILKLAKSMGFLTTLTTNGLLYPKLANRLRGLIDMLHFSLDSAQAHIHDTMRGVACFEKVMESVRIATELGERPDILFTVFDHNIDQIEAVWTDICKPAGLMLILNPAFSYNQIDAGAGLSPQNLDLLELWGRKPGIFLNQAFITLRRDGGNQTSAPVCKAATSTIVISPENKLILPCYHLGLETFDIDNNLYALWKSKTIQELAKQEGRLPGCQGCTINCYMQPSFAVEINKYWWQALPSMIKYNLFKQTGFGL